MKMRACVIRGGVLVLVGFFFLQPALWAASSPDRQELLNKLVEGAKKERELVIWGGIPALGENGAREYGEAFMAAFGLKNLRFKYDTAGATGAKISSAITETKMGLPASYDVMYAPDHRVVALKEGGGIEPITNWQLLLPAGVDPQVASPAIVAGYGFLFGTREKANIYNEKLISYDEMPRTTRDVGLPRYKGKFYTSAWTTTSIYGPLIYSKEEWLEIQKGWGRNKLATITSEGGVTRMALGEFAFEPFSNAYLHIVHKEKGDPIGLHVFEDFTALSYIFYAARKNARNPNVAKLFTLWATGADAVKILEKYSGTGNVYSRASKVGAKVMDLVTQRKGKLVSWFDSPAHLKLLNWYTTKEGQDYEDQLAVALGLK